MIFKKPISISFAPNFEKDDTVLAVKLLLGLNKNTSTKDTAEKLRQSIKTIFPKGGVSLFSSGRSALYYAIKSLGLSNGDEVLLQAFTCVAVPNAVVWNGLVPVFVDVDDTYNLDSGDLEKKITPRTRAVVVQHTFGIPANMKAIQMIAKRHKLLIVEDCAHALGGSIGDDVLGSFGDVSVLSFGRDKVVSSVFGGAVVAHNPMFAAVLSQYEAQLERAPRIYTVQQLLYLIIYAMSLPFYNVFFGKLLLRLARWFGLLSQAVYKKEWAGQMPFFVHYAFPEKLQLLAVQQLKKLRGFSEHRTKLSAFYIEKLDLVMKPGPYLRIPYRVKNKSRFLSRAKERGLHLGNWYRGAVDPVGSSLEMLGYQPCPHAEKLAHETINLPTHINVSLDDAQKIVTFVKNYE